MHRKKLENFYENLEKIGNFFSKSNSRKVFVFISALTTLLLSGIQYNILWPKFFVFFFDLSSEVVETKLKDTSFR